MALIGKIRRNGYILVVMLALGLGGFVIMDMFSGQQSIFGSQQFLLGEIDGKKLDWNQFYNTEQILYRSSGGDVFARREALWNYFVEEQIVREEADALGLGVSKEELMDLQFGTNLSPVIQQRFQDPQTRQVDREQLSMIRQQIEDNTLDPSVRPYWAHQENEIIKDRLQSKLSAMVAKGIYTPTWMAEMLQKEQGSRFDLAYVRVPFDDIDNNEVALTDEDFESYFSQHKFEFKQEKETRRIAYLSFDVVPTAEDSAAIRKQVADLVPNWEQADNDTLFVESNFGNLSPQYYTREDVPAVIVDTVFSMPEGSVYGPYLDQGAYQAVKLLTRVNMADSADTRHILLQATTPEDLLKAGNKIDSIKQVIESGQATFEDMATQFSQDPGSSNNGGKYEGVTPNQFVPQFNEVLFVTGQIGPLYKVRTDFGWHLVEILKRSNTTTPRVKLGFVGSSIIPSDETQTDIYNEVYQFVQKHRTLTDLQNAADGSSELELVTSPPVKRNDYVVGDLGSSSASREVIRWAFGDDANVGRPDIGDVSPNIYSYQDEVEFYNNRYVVAALKSIIPAGVPQWKEVRAELEPLVVNEKKAEIIKGRISSSELTGIASTFGTEVDTARNVTFSGGFIAGLGNEPKVIAKAMNMEPNTVSEPVQGASGVFVFKVLNKTDGSNQAIVGAMRNQFASNVRANVRSRLIQTMKEESDITDNRARFY